MEALLISLATVAVAEMGDRTQLLSLVLATHYRQPWPILGGILLATLANHAAAGILGVWFGRFLSPALLDGIVGAGMLAMALWTLKPDRFDEDAPIGRRGAFLAALVAGYESLLAVVAGTTLGMLLANAPVVFLGKAFADRLPMSFIHRAAAA